MNYDDAVNYIHSLLKFGVRPGLFGMDALLSDLGHPERSLKYVHIAGTNGKGSTSTAVSNIMIEAGYRVGLYTSPYVTDFLERVQFGGKPVDKTLFALCVFKVKNAVDKLNSDGITVTEFEALTAAAFLCFCELKCDLVVLEVGLGGRLDATNVIPVPYVNIITSLSIDHSAILGDTIEKIAYEKCGTIKENANVITTFGQPAGALSVIKKTVAEKNAALTIPDENDIKIVKSDIFGTEFLYNGKEYFVPMPGLHQVKNAVCAIEGAKVLKTYFNITDENIIVGTAKTVLPARIEVISEKPLVILDGGHNEDGAKVFFDTVSPYFNNSGKTVVIAGMLADKAVEKSLLPLMKKSDVFVAVTPDNPRAMSCEELAKIASKYCDEVYREQSVECALKKFLSCITADDILCVVGSLYLAGEARPLLLKKYAKD